MHLQVESLARWGLALKSDIPLFHLVSGISLNVLFPCTQDVAPTKHILVLLFSSNYTVCIYSLSSLLPFMIDMHTMITDVHMWESILGCLEISSATTINLKPFSLFSGKFLGQGQKAAHSLQKNVTRIVSKSLTNILLFCNSLSCPFPCFKSHCKTFYVTTRVVQLNHSTAFLVQSLTNLQQTAWSFLSYQHPGPRL